MSRHLGRKDDLIQLERTGPYVPPISFSGPDIVVTDAFRRQLESSGLIGLGFRPVIKKHIVRLDWRSWDLSANMPAEIPQGGEPGNYILAKPHSPNISDQMGDLWELVSGFNAKAKESAPGRTVLIGASWQGADFFKAENGWRSVLVSEKAMEWLQKDVGEHVHFMEVTVV
jgi:hypothetical protein